MGCQSDSMSNKPNTQIKPEQFRILLKPQTMCFKPTNIMDMPTILMDMCSFLNTTALWLVEWTTV